jgi:hypothetical protein
MEINGRLFVRMEYLYQPEAEDRRLREVALTSISSDYPNKPYGFVTTGAICEELLTDRSAERDRILYSFRP